MAHPTATPSPGANDYPGQNQDGEDDVDRIQHAWERERPGTPAGSIGVITRVWRIGKLLADERRRTLARLGIDAATPDLLSTLLRHEETLLAALTEDQREDLAARLKTLLASLAPGRSG